jgi:hypothetical protein
MTGKWAGSDDPGGPTAVFGAVHLGECRLESKARLAEVFDKAHGVVVLNFIVSHNLQKFASRVDAENHHNPHFKNVFSGHS